MSDSLISGFDSLPEFLNSHDLVKLGLWPSDDAVYLARLRGLSPDFIKLGKKILYPKASVIEFIQRHLKSGEGLALLNDTAKSRVNNHVTTKTIPA